jgi:hypothetical protein
LLLLRDAFPGPPEPATKLSRPPSGGLSARAANVLISAYEFETERQAVL